MLKMKIIAAGFVFASPVAWATAPTMYSNAVLGYHLTIEAVSSKLNICDNNNACLSFKTQSEADSDPMIYDEVSGKCSIAVSRFDKSFGQGDTANEFMLDLTLQTVRVTQGEDQCVLHQVVTGQARSLTGIYQ